MFLSNQAFKKLTGLMTQAPIAFKKKEWDDDQHTQEVKYRMPTKKKKKKRRNRNQDDDEENWDPTKFSKLLYVIDGTEHEELYIRWRMEYEAFVKAHYNNDVTRKENLISQLLRDNALAVFNKRLKEIDEDKQWGKDSPYAFDMSERPWV